MQSLSKQTKWPEVIFLLKTDEFCVKNLEQKNSTFRIHDKHDKNFTQKRT